MTEADLKCPPSAMHARAVAALLTHPTRGAAAKAVGVGIKTLWRWEQQPEFRAALQQAQAAAFASGLQALKGALCEAVAQLRLGLRSRDARMRHSAARALVELALKSHEALEIEARLQTLEERMATDETEQHSTPTT